MRDLDLWARLGGHDDDGDRAVLTEPRLLQALVELAEVELSTRAPLLGKLIGERHHPDPRVRAAVIRALTGATGILGLRAIVEALDDDADEVRSAAVDALLGSARTGQHLRLAHALLHPRADVRRRAAERTPIELRWIGGYLRQDPVCGPLVRAWPLQLGLRVGLDLHARGLASDAEIAGVLAGTEDDELLGLVRYRARRRKPELEALWAWLDGGASPNMGGDTGQDWLDTLVAILDRAAAAGTRIGGAMAPLVRGRRHADAGERLVAAILLRLLAEGQIADPLLTFAVREDPRLLSAARIPVAIRQAALRLYARSEPRTAGDLELGRALLRSPVVARPDGSLDLSLAACVGWLLPAPQLAWLLDATGPEPVLAALTHGDIDGFLGLCRLPDPSDELGQLLARLDPGQAARLRGAAMLAWAKQRERVRALIASLPATELRASILAMVELDRELAQAPEAEPGRADERPRSRLTTLVIGELPAAERMVLVTQLLTRKRGGAAGPIEPPSALEAGLIHRCLRELDEAELAGFVRALPDPALLRLLTWMRDAIQLPVAVEGVIVTTLRSHRSSELRAIAGEITPSPVKIAAERPRITAVHTLTAAEATAISSAAEPRLAHAVAPALAQPTLGLPAALAGRSHAGRHDGPCLEVCVALLGAHDPIADSGAALARYFDPEVAEFEAWLTTASVEHWQRNPATGPLGHAWLYAFEQHALAFGDWLVHHGLPATLDRCAALAPRALRIRCFEAAAYALSLWRYRDKPRLAALELGGWPAALVERLDTELGPAAAKMLVTLYLAGLCPEELEDLRVDVRGRGPDFDQVTRHELHRWVRLDGLPERERAVRAAPLPVRVGLLEQIAASEDLDWLGEHARSPRRVLVEAAVLRLVELGEAGEAQLALALAEPKPVPCFDVIVESVPMWRSLPTVADLDALIRDPELDGQLRYRLAMALVERGAIEAVEVAIAVLLEPTSKRGWFQRKDWDRLVAHSSTGALAHALATSPHPHAFTQAVDWLLRQAIEDHSVLGPLRAFLAEGTQRPRYLRQRAADRLLAAGDPSAAPVLLVELFDAEAKSPPIAWIAKLAADARAQVFDAVVAAALVGGQAACGQRRALQVFETNEMNAGGPAAQAAFDDAVRRLFVDTTDDHVRARLAHRATSAEWRQTMLQGIAEIFAWGVRRGRELTGRLFRVQMTDKRQDFGYTLLHEDRIFVTPLPFFSGERHGQAIVEALLLHELGHHMFHRGDHAEVVWKRAQARGLHGVLNLVADEHLERNLRSLRGEYGDRLKRLAAHAFLHAERDLDWRWLLDTLGASSFAVLSGKPTQPAHHPGQLRVSRGALLQALEAGGSSWARFARALRMGLGDRWGDAKVAAGLALFTGQFRHADMDELWRITEALAALFAEEIPLSHVCGGHETLGEAEREGQVGRGGIGDEQVQVEVERILDPRELDRGEGKGPPGKLAINVGADERFDLITRVERVPRDPDKHRKLAREVSRHAHRLRAYLCELGLDLVPRRARLRGRAFDRTRALPVVLRQDPRMLVARELEIHSDLFIGVLIDCSGSMSTRDLLAKAQSFAVLIAEAVRALPGVEARFWGFTDTVIWDAGDADRCAVTSLEASGGNNDAAALYYAAQVAAGSRRRAKLLVMISDGLPTQCSVAALRNLVHQLGRRQQMVCAQVAVRPLSEICFPHYVLLADEPIELATMRFGELVSKLARRALGR